MDNEMKSKIDNLFIQSLKEYNDPQKLEFYECNKTEEIINLLLQDENTTLDYLSTATKSFFDFIFCEINDTAERLLQKYPSKEMISEIKKLCYLYKDENNVCCVENILRCLDMLK